MMQRTLTFVVLLAVACSDTTPSPQTPSPTAPHASPTAEGPTDRAPSPAPPVVDASRVPFEIHVDGTTARDPVDEAWVELAGAAFDSLPPSYALRASRAQLPGLSLVQLTIVGDPDGRSGTSRLPAALLELGQGDAPSFVHVVWDLPGTAGLTEATGLADVHLHVATCDVDAQRAVMAAMGERKRNTVVSERCRSLDEEVARAFLATADASQLDALTQDLLRRVHGAATYPGNAFRIATRRRGPGAVNPDARWLAHGTFVPWSATRDGDVVTASGTMLLERTWYVLGLRVDTGVTLSLSVVALADSRGVPP